MINLLSGSAALIDSSGRGTVNLLKWMRDVSRAVNGENQPDDVEAITATGSPLAFTATRTGTIIGTGGTVSSVTLTRAGVVTTVPNGFVPVSAGDVVTYTYTAAPTVRFIPR